MRRASPFESGLAWLREQIANSQLLPKAYDRYRPLLADGVDFFLRRLPASRLRHIFAGQFHLAPTTSLEQRLVALFQHVPALHKLGQVLARDRRLQPGFRHHLHQLETLPPARSAEQVARILDQQWPAWRKAGIQLGPRPVAEGSVAVIMPFELDLSRSRTRRKATAPKAGVLKLLKPGIGQLLDEDLKILGQLGTFLDTDCDRYHLPGLDYRETFETIRELLLHEVRLEQEQQHLSEAAQLYAHCSAVQIPRLFPFSSRQLTPMERVDGHKITGYSHASAPERARLAKVAAEALIAHPLFSFSPGALFHADPHAGNLFLTSTGRLAILDWSLAARLEKRQRVQLAKLLLAAVAREPEPMITAIGQLANQAIDRGAVEDVVRESLAHLRWGELPGMTWFSTLVDNLALNARVRFPGNLLLFRKSLLTLEGVLADLLGAEAAEVNWLLDEVLLKVFLEHWTVEWPWRLGLPWASHASSTHLSTADLLKFTWSAPLILARWTTQTGVQLLENLMRPLRAAEFI